MLPVLKSENHPGVHREKRLIRIFNTYPDILPEFNRFHHRFPLFQTGDRIRHLAGIGINGLNNLLPV